MLRPIIRWCLSNRSVVMLLTVIVMVGGVVSMTQLNQQLLPNISFPAAFILVSEPGAGPDQVDRDVAQPISTALTGLPGGKHVQTTSSQGFCEITVIFDYGTELKTDVDNVNQKLSQVQLPDSVGKPLVQTFDANSTPTMVYSLAARDGDLARITQEADGVILPALAGASGLARVTVSGSAERQVAITLDPTRMAARGVSVQTVQQALKAAQVDLPVGTTTQGGKTLPVQVVGTARTADDLRRLVVSAGGVAAGAAGAAAAASVGPTSSSTSSSAARAAAAAAAAAPVTLGDVATVQDATTPVGGITRTDGQPSVTISAILAPDGNAISLSKDVRDRLSKVQLNGSDSLRLVYDTATDVQRSLNDLIVEGVAGAVLAILVIFLFLRSIRGTLVTAVSLPTSILIALIGTKLAGYSLNVLTLAGLTIAIGRIVDDAIVVLENSYRHLQAGDPPRLAALNGASEVSMAIVSSTLTTVAVFLPIALVGGFITLLFLAFAVTVTVALVASLIVALTVVPVLVSLFLGWRVRRGQDRPFALTRVYQPILGWALGGWLRRSAVLVVTGVMLAVAVFSATRLPVNLFDFGGSTMLSGQVTLPVGTSTEQTSAQLRPFERDAQADANVRMVNVQIASSSEGAISFAPQTNTAALTVLVKDKKSADGVQKRLQADLDSLYGKGNGSISVSGGGGGANNTSFSATISGTDPTRMRQASDLILANLRQDAELTDVQSSLAADRPVVQVAVDPVKASAHGVSPQVVAGMLGQALSPLQVGTLGIGGPQVILLVDPSSVGADKLATMPLLPGVQLRDVATVSDQLAPQSIDRDNGTQQLTVSGTILGNDTSGASQRATKRIQDLRLPSGVGLSTGGAEDVIGTSFSNMFLAMGVGIGIVFLILVAFFRSLVTPLVILVTMPLSLIGGLLALFAFHQALGLSALLGVLMLFGVVVSNAILLVDFTEKERARERPLREALMAAGSVRLRPILMTALATVMALLPVATGLSTGGGGGLISQSLAIVVEGGLISSTALTLVVVPVIYSLVRRSWRRTELERELGAFS